MTKHKPCGPLEWDLASSVVELKQGGRNLLAIGSLLPGPAGKYITEESFQSIAVLNHFLIFQLLSMLPSAPFFNFIYLFGCTGLSFGTWNILFCGL